MRAIKFRAWDNVKNAMYYPGEEDLMLFMLADEGFRVDEVIPDDSISEGFYAERLEHLQFMQFTGLHDKNGVEIYEGDVVECFAIGLSRVKYKCGCFGIHNDKQGYFPFYELGGKTEVNGNIYENPELLEVPSC